MESPKLYVDYKGGAGPDEQQSQNNDKAMGMALSANKIPFTWTDEFAKKHWDGDDMQMKIQRSDGNVIYVSYDRWGFVIDQLSEGDQDDLVTTLNIIKTWYNEKST